MKSETDSRIQEIQSKAREERAAVSKLDDQVGDTYLKQLLRRSSHLVDDVENIFLRSARQEPRTPEALSSWLAHAEAVLHLAEQQRKLVESVVATYGPNAKSTAS